MSFHSPIKTYEVSNPRLKLIVFIAIFAFSILFGTLLFRQVFQHSVFSDKAQRQTLRRVVLPAPRGDIFDRNGSLLVSNAPRFSAVIYLNELQDEIYKEYKSLVIKEKKSLGGKTNGINFSELRLLAQTQILQEYLNEINVILGKNNKVKVRKIIDHISQNKMLPFPLIKDLSYKEQAILAEKLPVSSPIQIFSDTQRYYPEGSLAPHLLGYVSSDFDLARNSKGLPNKDLKTYFYEGKIGKSGVEKAFEEHIKGKNGYEVWLVDPNGYQYKKLEYKEPVKGENIYLSIDLELQKIAEKALGEKKGSIVVLDVQSGQVLAMASKPDYNPEDLSPFISTKVWNDISQRGAWLNRATQGLKPPGSLFKLVTAIAALKKDPSLLDKQIVCNGVKKIGNRTFVCKNHAPGITVDLKTALEKSCNVYFYELAEILGIDLIHKQACDFNLDTLSGIELPGETRSMLVGDPTYKRSRLYESWTTGDTVNISIGQGFLLQTPLQMACMFASIARCQDKTFATIIRGNNTVKKGIEKGEIHALDLDKTSYEAIIDGMISAVETGTAKKTKISGVSIAGKTGTAQVPDKGKMSTVAWFAGFAPTQNPKIAICVMVESLGKNSTTSHLYGGSVAAPLALELFKTTLSK